MPPKDSNTGLAYEFYSAVIQKGHLSGNFFFTVYAIGENGVWPIIKRGGFNTNTENLHVALRRHGFRVRNTADESVEANGDSDRLVLTVMPVN